MSASTSLSDEIGRLLLCTCQALLKCDDDPDMNYVRQGLGEYVMELHQSEHLIPEKRIQLISEVLYCTDKDHLSKNQFFESVLGIKSSDEVRHWLHKVHHYLRNLGKTGNSIQSHVTETPNLRNPDIIHRPDERVSTYQNYLNNIPLPPTFEDQYPEMQSKRIKLNKKEWNFENFLYKILNDLYENPENIEVLDISKDNQQIIYTTEERPNDERNLIDDLKTILYENDTSNIPIGILLLLLERILNVLDYEDKHTMPKPMLQNLMSLMEDYPKFRDHILFE